MVLLEYLIYNYCLFFYHNVKPKIKIQIYERDNANALHVSKGLQFQ